MSNIIPVEERIKDAYASERGLYPHEILALEFAPRCTNKDKPDSFQNFWWYDYGVKDVPKILSSLFNRGFLQIENINDAAHNENNATLKIMLQENNLKVTGKKEDMIKRLFENLQSNILENIFDKRKYQLTELGIDELNKSKYIFYVHGKTIEDLNIWSLNKLVYSNPRMSFRDVIWKYLNQRTVKHTMEGQFGLYRNCRYSMALFLTQEEKYKNALAFLAEAAFYGLASYPSDELPPGLIFDIALCIKKINYTDNEIINLLNELTNGLVVPNQKKSAKEYIQIIVKQIKIYLKNNPDLFIDENNSDEDIEIENTENDPVKNKLLNDMLLFLENEQPILQKDFISAWRESQPFSRIGDTKGQVYFLEEIFKLALDTNKLHREKVGRAFTLYVNK